MRRDFSPRSLEGSFATSTALLVLGLIGVTLAVVHSQLAAALRRGLEARGVSIARSIGAVATPSLLSYNYPALQIAAEAAAGDPDVAYVTIHDKEGAEAGVARSRSDAPNDERNVLEITVPVEVEGVDEPWGTVRVGMDYASARRELRSLVLELAALGLTLALAAVTGGRWVARRVTAPLRELAHGTEALSAGEHSHRIPVRGARELADLARAFNRMMDRVEDKARESAEFQTALARLNATLEQQVEERTRALRESETQYKTLVEHSPDSILIVQAGRIRFVNRAFTEMFGAAEAEALSDRFDLARIFDVSSATLARGRIAAWERGEAAGPVEVLGQDRAARIRQLELRGSRIEYRGQPAAECLLIDMSEAIRLRERLAQSEKLRALGELASGVAHDFNNLLAAVLGRVQLLRRRSFEPGVDRDLGVIETAAQDGRETVRRILEFSRVRHDRPLSVVNLAAIVGDALEMTRASWKGEAEARGVSIEVTRRLEPVPPVLGNASELREVFTNLILNAADAMPDGGTLAVACRADGDRVVVEVRDTGVGMSSQTRLQLFDPFFTTKGTRGTGLGMSVVYGIVTRHGGRIDVASEVGRGSAFQVELPAASPALGPPGELRPIPTAPGRPARLLVIDDEPEVAAVLRDALASEGHEVDVASCGRDGLSLAAERAYDVVLTDLGMPDMSGWEVADQVSRLCPGVPVALVTGWGTTLDEEEVRRRGIAAVVHKPFEVGALARTAAAMVELVDARRERDPSGSAAGRRR